MATEKSSAAARGDQLFAEGTGEELGDDRVWNWIYVYFASCYLSLPAHGPFSPLVNLILKDMQKHARLRQVRNCLPATGLSACVAPSWSWACRGR